MSRERHKELSPAFAAGYASFVAWSDLVDQINVFPVADGDTGTNLRISLAPLREIERDRASAARRISRSATGNSGNIAAAFFREFIQAATREELAECAAIGCRNSWQAVAKPRAGTMLSVFDALKTGLERDDSHDSATLEKQLCRVVQESTGHVAELQRAGVVDAGALAMFIFFAGFFRQLDRRQQIRIPVLDLFKNQLSLDKTFQGGQGGCCCVDATLKMEDDLSVMREKLAALGESVVVVRDDSRLKIHVHTEDPAQLRERLAVMGDITCWSDEAIDTNGAARLSAADRNSAMHCVTDGAGSLPRSFAVEQGITLLDSYIVYGNQSRPESLCAPAEMYGLMRQGTRVTTAQASTFERQQCYESLLRRFDGILYLCVGSAFTGNYGTAMAWKEKNDPDDLFKVLDTGAASGRLALITLLTARYAAEEEDVRRIVRYAEKCCHDVREYIFIDDVHYLARGGRVSRAGSFFGGLFHLKPVISPMPDGVRKMGVVRSRKGQLEFALEKLKASALNYKNPVVLLQYSDNREWVQDAVQPQVRALLPGAELLPVPLSLTSGVHMGPGTWGLACGDGPVCVSP